jgi:hypothetical protein
MSFRRHVYFRNYATDVDENQYWEFTLKVVLRTEILVLTGQS